MAVYEKTIKAEKKDIVDRAKKFFGPNGQGLKVTSENDCCLNFEGGGGYVAVRFEDRTDGKLFVELETREWDLPTKRFLSIL